jgi:hypothetical protein
MQLPPLATSGCAGDERWSPGAVGFMEQYRRLALGGTAPGGTCSLGSVGDLRSRTTTGEGKTPLIIGVCGGVDEREGMVVQKPCWHAGMVGKEASIRSLCSTPSRRQIHLPHLRRPRGGPAAARVRDSKQELPGAILVQELRQLACATASAAHG